MEVMYNIFARYLFSQEYPPIATNIKLCRRSVFAYIIKMFDGVLWYLLQWGFLIALGYFGFCTLANITADDDVPTSTSNSGSHKPYEESVKVDDNTLRDTTISYDSTVIDNLKHFNNFNLQSSSDNDRYISNKTTIQNFQEYIPSSYSANALDNNWTNDLINWIFYNVHRVPKPLESWIDGLNEAAKKINNPQGTELIFEGYGDHSNIFESPSINNIRVESGPREQLTLKANIYLPGVITKIVTSQRMNDRLMMANFDAHILNLSGEVEGRLASIANQLFFMGCFNGRPEFKIELIEKDNSSQGSMMNCCQIEDAVRRCIVMAVTNINLSEFNVSDSTDQFPSHMNTNISNMPVYEVVKRLHKSQIPSSFDNNHVQANKLRVKVIRAQRLGNNRNVLQPYVIVEMDEPSRRYKTSHGINISPYWEESFDFTITPVSEEILFEVYEGDPTLCRSHQGNNLTILPTKEGHQEDDNSFLGLAIVGLDELRRSNEALHCLRLQGRPYKNDNVSGTLTVEFQFYHDPTVKEIGENQEEFIAKENNTGVTVKETVTVTKTPLFHDSNDMNQHIDLTPTRTTTLTVKTVSQQLKEKPLIKSVHGSMENAMDPATSKALEHNLQHLDIDQVRRRVTQSSPDQVVVSEIGEYDILHQNPYENNSCHKDNYNNYPDSQQIIYSADTMSRSLGNKTKEKINRAESLDNITKNGAVEKSRSSRGREKSGNIKEKRDSSFFGQLRDRLSGRRSKSKLRAKSVDFEKNQDLEEAVSLPPSREQSRTRHGSEFTRNYVETKSIGNESNISGDGFHSTSVILELSQGNNLKKYFLIPQHISTEPAAQKLLKKGKKLHVSNDHTFVAVKIRGGTVCNVCKSKIAGSFSKQAYQCRDCRLVCHKSCHTKTISPCQQTNYHNLAIVKDVDWGHFFTTHHLEEFISPPGV
uniref:C2 domain-containing protein n=1 Tax=Parastrongyloides trichosuri TaxID=131310 RepID=A0A0N4ZB12_PARTI